VTSDEFLKRFEIQVPHFPAVEIKPIAMVWEDLLTDRLYNSYYI